ncbi:hypothetical protein ASE21_02870 [Flavobacterium sp. Root901]|uniref:hypothetical protein n=1 Tax=Flavobacterium sp. Root901 TaxID=1736605 RepID=UPI00070C56B6|nr:hypothetical protein [Flavobacterium sp. Root901]KRD12869.1 hypothetical protein ASE21_02870 [Flavobacterium sp. Root901]
MNKSFIIFPGLLLLITACTQSNSEKIRGSKPLQIETNNNYNVLENKDSSNSVKGNFSNKSLQENSSIKIIESKLIKNQYSDHRDIKIVFKNSGKKDIQAIKFEWYCENSFNEPANGRYFYGEGRFTGEITCLLKAGKSVTKVWEDFSTDANRIMNARAYYVVFTDGTKWKLNKSTNH